MIKIITGIPGSGKTLWAVTQLKKIVDENNKLPEIERRKIYSDITGLELENVISPPPLDWRDTPPNSLLVYDEAQFNEPFQASAKDLSPYDYIQNLTIHRKTAHEIWYITQDPKRLHSNILTMADQHFHLDRPHGAKLATVYQFRGVERTPKSASAIARADNKSIFKYDKKIFDYYESSQIDDGIKLRLPKKMIIAVLIPFVLAAIAYYLFSTKETQKVLTGSEDGAVVTDTNSTPQDTNISVQNVDPLANPAASSSAPVEHYAFYPENVVYQKIANIVSSDTNCIASDINGVLLDIPVDICFKFIDNPYSASFIPMDVLSAINVETSESESNSNIEGVVDGSI